MLNDSKDGQNQSRWLDPVLAQSCCCCRSCLTEPDLNRTRAGRRGAYRAAVYRVSSAPFLTPHPPFPDLVLLLCYIFSEPRSHWTGAGRVCDVMNKLTGGSGTGSAALVDEDPEVSLKVWGRV